MKKLIISNIVLIVFILLFGVNKGITQTENTKNNNLGKNIFYLDIGTSIAYLSATGYYERILVQNVWNTKISPFIKIGYGGYVLIDGSGQYLLSNLGFLTGTKKHHMEISVGPIYYKKKSFSTTNIDELITISGSLGWRFQKPGGSVIFRTGVGLPMGLYLGIGFSI